MRDSSFTSRTCWTVERCPRKLLWRICLAFSVMFVGNRSEEKRVEMEITTRRSVLNWESQRGEVCLLGITARRSVSNWERTRTHNQKEAKGPI